MLNKKVLHVTPVFILCKTTACQYVETRSTLDNEKNIIQNIIVIDVLYLSAFSFGFPVGCLTMFSLLQTIQYHKYGD